MSRRLVLVHGRAQQQKDSVALKASWLSALHEGLQKSGLTLPIPENDVAFPYYGDALFDLVGGKSDAEAADVIVRGETGDPQEVEFTRAIMREIQIATGITDAQLAEVAGHDVVERGPLNWEWFQGLLRAVDRFVPGGSGTSIALVTHDVYHYLKNQAIRDEIDAGVAAAVEPGVETVLVAHSLGTVVAYNILRNRAASFGWNVVLFVTLGSPLAVGEIRKSVRRLNPPVRCPQGVARWFNAMDERDVVALYPLSAAAFPLDPVLPEIENKTDIDNRTENRHGIDGYLDDATVAKTIYEALVAP